jgi:hypothetical protein
MDLQRERRRSLNSLSLCGTGAIGLGLWSVIKAIMTFFANRNYIAEMISDIYTNSGVSEEEVSLKAVAFINSLRENPIRRSRLWDESLNTELQKNIE